MSARNAVDPALFVALLAGGRGTRFWPLSRHAVPKQLLDVTGEGPLLRVTRDRVAALTPEDNVLVVTSEDLGARCRRMLDLPARNVLAEPVGRNTAPAVGLALLVAATRHEDAVVLALPSDHHVSRPAQLRALLRRGVRAARRLRGVVLFGAIPDRPETGYGYLSPGEPVKLAGAAGLRRLRAFREKPDVAGARRLVRQGAWWNTGMFCLHAGAALQAIEETLPDLAAGLAELRPHLGRRSFGKALRDVYPRLPAVSFDHGVLERLPTIHALPADVGWSDVGSWESLAELLPGDVRGNRHRGEPVLHDAEGCVVLQAEGRGARTLVVLGAKDLVLVDAGDVVLACPRGRERDVKGLLARLARERPGLL